jgi:apolipoprotein N-acyltransferase
MTGAAFRAAETLRALPARRRAAAAALAGATAALALPPLHLLPLGALAFTALVWLLDGTKDAPRPFRAAFATGWWFGLGHHVIGLYWIANALLIEWERVGWMIPFAVFGLSALLAAFAGAATAAAARVGRGGVARVASLAVAWTAAEWLRGHVLTGFPWNLAASMWAETLPVLQAAAYVGAYGLTALTVLLFALPATLADRKDRPHWAPSVAGLLLLGIVASAGGARLETGDPGRVADVRLRLVQPNVPQALKWDPEARETNLAALIELSRAPGFETRTHVIWAETATAFPVWGDLEPLARRRAQVAQAVPPGGILVTGAPRFAREADGTLRVWNSLHALDGQGEIRATFDKFHLVPFGEYVPMRAILPIDRVVPGGMDFSAGPGPVRLEIPGLPSASPLICYEVIFPGEVVPAGARPQLLLNLTNDSWFGVSAGPYQHFAAARLRAVEEGLPLIRSAGGGISGVVDPYGRIVAGLDLAVAGVLDSDLPQSIPPTPYAQARDLSTLAVLILIAGLAVLRRRDLVSSGTNS